MTHDDGRPLPFDDKTRDALVMLRAALARLAPALGNATVATEHFGEALEAFKTLHAVDLGGPRGDHAVVSVARRNGMTYVLDEVRRGQIELGAAAVSAWARRALGPVDHHVYTFQGEWHEPDPLFAWGRPTTGPKVKALTSYRGARERVQITLPRSLPWSVTVPKGTRFTTGPTGTPPRGARYITPLLMRLAGLAR